MLAELCVFVCVWRCYAHRELSDARAVRDAHKALCIVLQHWKVCSQKAQILKACFFFGFISFHLSFTGWYFWACWVFQQSPGKQESSQNKNYPTFSTLLPLFHCYQYQTFFFLIHLGCTLQPMVVWGNILKCHNPAAGAG